MNKIVDDFLKEVKEQKVKQLLGVTLDKKYWAQVVGDTDIEVLRTDLSTEQEKMVKNRNGTVHADNRDMDKINSLNTKINAIEKATQELTRLEEMEKGINTYMEFVNKPDEETMKTLEEVAGL